MAARTASDIAQGIRASLSVVDPDISAEPLTPEGKIINVVAEVIAEAESDTYVLNYQYDIDSKVGVDLDKFVALFGFARQGGRRSTGFVTFTRASVSTIDVVIPIGTQVVKPGTSVSSAVVFQTTATGVIYAGTTTSEVPIECTVAGSLGNVPAASITSLGLGGAEISSLSNENASSGGTDVETDAELRVRFKNTIFRNISGTSDQYQALAIASRFANKANVIGPVSTFIEYLQIATGAATSQIPYSKYTYDFDYFLTDGAIAGETFFVPRGVDYTFNDTVPPSITVNNVGTLPNDTVILLEHTYCSINSRNDPTTNVNNYVDVYVSGTDAVEVIEAAVFPTSANNFNNTGGSPYLATNFLRDETRIAPIVGNRFQELLWQPVTNLPSSITIGATTYHLNTDYWFIKDVSVYKGSKRARNGIEWASTVVAAAGDAFSLTYSFDLLPITLNELMDDHKTVTTDVLVHSATLRYFNVYMTVMYTPGFSSTSVDQGITIALSDYFSKQVFGAIIQVSDILEITHGVPGVDNVRLTGSTEAINYGIQEISSDGVTHIGTPYTNDFSLQDSDLPVLNAISTTKRSQNTWSN